MKNKVIILGALAALLLSDTQLFAQPKSPLGKPPPIPTATIQGRVVDIDTNQGISGAYVAAGSHYSTNTDSNGYYKIKNIEVWRWGSVYTITASAEGYESSSKIVWVTPGRTSTVNFALRPKLLTSTIKGRVIDEDTSEGISQARVIAQSFPGKWRYEVYTDSQGYYEIKNVRTLRWGIYYRVSASGKEYHSEYHTLFVKPGITYTVNFTLTPVRPPVVLKITSPPDGYETKEAALDVKVYYRVFGWQRYHGFDEWNKIGTGPYLRWFRRTIDLKLDGKVVGTFYIPFWQREGTHTFSISSYSPGEHELQSFLYLDHWKKILLAKSNIVHFTYISDVTPPVISGITPPDRSAINNSQPEISAIVKDAESGVDPRSIQMTLDGQKVPHSYNSTTGKVSYIPLSALAEGLHKVTLSVTDNIGNEANKNWSFTVDTVAPLISDLRPHDGSLLNNARPEISVILHDATSGINPAAIIMKINSQTVTPTYDSSTGKVSYTPTTPLSDGLYQVNLEVKDKAGNSATASWSFTTDITPPVISNLVPEPESVITEAKPIISASYSDNLSGIDTSSVLIEVDNQDVTSKALVTATKVEYIPEEPLKNGEHIVVVEVKDLASNLASISWVFTVQVGPFFEIPRSVLDDGGKRSTSTDFILEDSIAQPSPIGFSSSVNFRLDAGYQQADIKTKSDQNE